MWPKGEKTETEEKQSLDRMSDKEILIMLIRQIAGMQERMKAGKEKFREEMKRLKEGTGEGKRKQERKEKEMEERMKKKLGHIERKINKISKEEEVRKISKILEKVKLGGK